MRAGPDQAYKFGLGQTGPTQTHANYLQKREQLLFTFCMQPNGCRRFGWAEEKTIGSGGHGHDQEVELMVSVASLRATVVGVDHEGRKKDSAEVRERKQR